MPTSSRIQYLQESEARLRVQVEELEFLVANSPIGALFSENGVVLRANPETAKLFAYGDVDEMIGMATGDLFTSHESYGEFCALVPPILAANQAVDLRWPMRRKDGSTVIARLTGRALPPSRYEHGAIWMMEDITEHLRQEEELVQHREHLEQLVERRTGELRQSNQQLQESYIKLQDAHKRLLQSEKMAALGSLVVGVAHQLNTPIGNSVTVASALGENMEQMLNDVTAGTLRRSAFTHTLEASLQGIELLMRNLRRSAAIINSFKQIAVDQASNQRRTFDLQQMIGEILVMLSPTYSTTTHTLVLNIDTQIEMDSYPGALGQIIGSFISNALTHAFVGREHGVMTIATRLLDTETVELLFRDDGVGIPSIHQHRVFEPFFTTSLGQGGSGLGMSIVYNLVTELLGGHINLQSIEGQGTTYTLILPRLSLKI